MGVLTFKVPETLASSYHGSGWALAASSNGVLVALRYLQDIAPAIADTMGNAPAHAQFFFRQWLSTAQAGSVVRELQALGDVHAGMLSCWEFVEL